MVRGLTGKGANRRLFAKWYYETTKYYKQAAVGFSGLFFFGYFLLEKQKKVTNNIKTKKAGFLYPAPSGLKDIIFTSTPGCEPGVIHILPLRGTKSSPLGYTIPTITSRHLPRRGRKHISAGAEHRPLYSNRFIFLFIRCRAPCYLCHNPSGTHFKMFLLKPWWDPAKR